MDDVLENHGIPVEVQAAAEALLRLANRHKVVVAGYLFGLTPPFIVNFGNCSDSGELRLYQMLCDMHARAKTEGSIIHIPVAEIQ